MGKKTGHPGKGFLKLMEESLEKYSEDWWTQLHAMMMGDDKNDRKFAMSEFNKIQIKKIPQEQSHTGEISVKWSNGDNDTVSA